MSEKDFIENLILNVKKYECLYNKRHHGYFNKSERSKYWEQIAESTGMSSEVCHKRWRLLREKFTKESRKLHRLQGKKPRALWPFYTQMEFIKDYIQPKAPDGKNESQSMEGEDSISQIYTDKNSTRRRTSESSFQTAIEKFEETLEVLKNKITEQSDNPDDLFGKMLVAMLKELPQQKKDEVRMHILNYLMEIRKI